MRHPAARAVVALGFAAVAVVAAAEPASAGILRFLFGGSNGMQNRTWEYASGRQVVVFSERFKVGTIIVSFADRRLYLVSSPGRAISYPIGTPADKAKWAGETWVSSKRIDPDWTPTPEMRLENPNLPSRVAGGDPRNPLGPRALYLGKTLYRIHGTDAPWTVGQEVSHGCVRLYNRDIIDLYNRVPVGSRVIVTWRRFLTG